MMFDFWRTLLASFGFGAGWAIAAWYRGLPRRSPSLRVGRDIVMAGLVAPPALMIAMAIASNAIALDKVL